MLVGDFGDQAGDNPLGFQLGLINFGYLFSKYVGVSATIVIAGYSGSDHPHAWSYTGYMAGLFLSFPISEKVELDIRPMAGYATIYESIGIAPFAVNDKASAFAYSIGTLLRIHLGGRVSFLFNADYFSTTPELFDEKRNLGTISFGAGIAFRIK